MNNRVHRSPSAASSAWSWKSIFLSEFFFWVALAIACIALLMPLRQKIRFGFDLSGGTYLTLEVDTNKAIEAELIEFMQDVVAKCKENNIKKPISQRIEGKSVIFEFENLQHAQSVASIARGLPSGSQYEQDAKGNVIKYTLLPSAENVVRTNAVERNIEVLRARVPDVDIMRKGEDKIAVELPDVADPQQAKAMIGKAAQLEFRLVYNDAATIEDLEFEYDGIIPVDKEILPGSADGAGRHYYLVQRYADVTGRFLKDASPSLGGESGREAVVSFKFNATGARKFYELTSSNYGKRLAIVLDGVVVSAPMIKSAISDAGQISGNYTIESARETATLLNSGSFVAPVSFAEERSVGPSLGRESIQQGLWSCVVGLILLFVFSIGIYSLSGFFAFVTLLYNLLFILICLWITKLPLTLPGIGGMVLTVGMAIDTSVLIFEEIKELLAQGEQIRKAVITGFSKAMGVILDANITTFVAGIVLYWFGTGPIQGFAVTMMFGIVATLVTGLFFQRALFKFLLDNFNVQKLRI